MSSNNERRDWIEVGVDATLSRVYAMVAAILVSNFIASVAVLFFATSATITAFIAGISMGLLAFIVVSTCTVKADKISRKWA